MKRIKLQTVCPRASVMQMLLDNAHVNAGLNFDDREGAPTVQIKQGRDGRVRMRCYMVGGPTKDNGFIQGTFFVGRIREDAAGMCHVRGVIMTEPVFHLAFAALIVVAVVQMLKLGGVSLTPILLIPFVYFMFRKEYRKQEYLRRYILRAVRRLEKGEK